MIPSIVRSAVLAGFFAVGGMPAFAQEVVAPATVEEVFGKLVQLQEANLGVARQIAETQLRAADAIQVVIDEKKITDEAQLKLAQTFVDNARTLASVVLAPMGTENVATGDTMQRLVRSNIVMFERARSAAASNADLAAAFDKYAVLQAQTEDLLVALANGWDRYGEVVRTAEIAGMIRPGSFDSGDASWRLVNPDPTQQVAAVAPAPELAEKTAADAGPTPLAALTGTPGSPGETELAAVEPVAQPPAPDDQVSAEGSGKIGDWTVAADGTGLLVASSPNLNPETADRIASITIACGENGTLYYQVAASADYGSYVAYSDDALSRSVSAEGNIIRNADASALADTLRLSADWAAREPAANRRMVVAAVEDAEIPAQFSPAGYMEARGRVLDACVEGIVAQAMGAPAAELPAAAAPAASPTVAAADLPPGATIREGLVAPIPKVRPKTFNVQAPPPTQPAPAAAEPAPAVVPVGPLDIMGGT